MKLPAVVFGALQAADVHSTDLALDRGFGREANPALAGIIDEPGKVIAVKAAVTAGVLTTTALIGKKHPKAAKVTLWILNGAMVAVVANNYRIAQGPRR